MFKEISKKVVTLYLLLLLNPVILSDIQINNIHHTSLYSFNHLKNLKYKMYSFKKKLSTPCNALDYYVI